MYCVGCGKMIPDDSNFCAYCGKSQKGGDRPPDQEERWETCEIGYQKRGIPGFPKKFQFFVQAYGPKGQYTAGESSWFGNDFLHSGDSWPNWKSKAVNQAFDDLVNKLLRDGWDHVGQGEFWWNTMFRRKVK